MLKQTASVFLCLVVGVSSDKNVMALLEYNNVDQVDILCQIIMQRIYTNISKYDMKTKSISTFNMEVLKSLQTNNHISFHCDFKKILDTIKDNAIKRVLVLELLL